MFLEDREPQLLGTTEGMPADVSSVFLSYIQNRQALYVSMNPSLSNHKTVFLCFNMN